MEHVGTVAALRVPIWVPISYIIVPVPSINPLDFILVTANQMTPRFLIISAILSSSASAHDTWVETNTNIVRTGDAVYVDLKLGNHGNEHRDFKLAGKADLTACSLQITGPDGKEYDLKPSLLDVGYAPKEGYHTAKFATARPGLYVVGHTLDQVVSYAPVRSVKSANAYFLASNSLDKVGRDHPGFDHAFGHALELVPISNPITPMGPGQNLKVQLLFEGKPLANAKVSFVPRGHELKQDFDADYERTTDGDGMVSFTPKTGNVYLIVAHHQLPRSGAKFESTKYSATISLFVPEICPCYDE